jgi:hypothetical protein
LANIRLEEVTCRIFATRSRIDSPLELSYLHDVSRGFPIPRWGNLRRLRPFSDHFGFERGTPVDRFYLHRFLASNADKIRGAVLEIQRSDYTSKYGVSITESHSLDISPQFEPTYLCDLADAHVVTSDRYDCFLLPNTLNVLRDISSCLREMVRVVRPGGSVLAAAACLGPFMTEAPDYWRMGVAGWSELATQCWNGHDWVVEGHGNLIAASAAMMGLAHEELNTRELEFQDDRYPILVTLSCTKR